MMNPVRFYGYKHWTLEDSPRCFNVGKGQGRRHSSRNGRNHKWHAIVKKYGFRVEVCIGPVTNEEACQWEIEEIKKEGTFTSNHSHDDPNDIGCNFTIGGDGSTGHTCTHTDDARRKMSLSHKGKRIGELHPMFGKHHTSESRAKMGRSGDLNPMFGKKHAEKSLQKMSESHRGRLRTESAKKKTSESCKVWHQNNPDFRAYKSLSQTGERNPRSKLTWEKVREIRSKYVPRIYTKPMLALEYDISESVIGKILAGISWKEPTMNANDVQSDVDPKVLTAYEAWMSAQQAGRG
jgi:group I intron endonuclease